VVVRDRAVLSVRYKAVLERTCDLPPHAAEVWWVMDTAFREVLFDEPFVQWLPSQGFDFTAMSRAMARADELNRRMGR
jgi:hypothetical protein